MEFRIENCPDYLTILFCIFCFVQLKRGSSSWCSWFRRKRIFWGFLNTSLSELIKEYKSTFKNAVVYAVRECWVSVSEVSQGHSACWARLTNWVLIPRTHIKSRCSNMCLDGRQRQENHQKPLGQLAWWTQQWTNQILPKIRLSSDLHKHALLLV